MSDKTGKYDPRVDEVLKTAWRMKPSDLSVLEAAMQHGSGIMLTNQGRDKARLWSQFVGLDMMRVAPLPAEFQRVADGKCFELIDRGREKVPVLFEILKLAKEWS